MVKIIVKLPASVFSVRGSRRGRVPDPPSPSEISFNYVYIINLPNMPRISLGKLKYPSDFSTPTPEKFSDPRMFPLLEIQNYSSKPLVKFPGSPHIY